MSKEKKLTGYPSIDKPWMKYYSVNPEKIPLPEMTLYRNVWENNREHLEDVALNYFGNRITYRTLFERVDACAKALTAFGVGNGDCITLCMNGIAEAAYLILACSKIGAIANFINPLFDTEQKIARINESETKFLFVMDKMFSYVCEVAEKIAVEHIVVVSAFANLPTAKRTLACIMQKRDSQLQLEMKQNTGFVTWESFLEKGKTVVTCREEDYKKDRPVIMVYSSGTTGGAKGIVLTNDGVNATISHYISPDFPYERGNTFLQVIPFWFSTGCVLNLMMPLCLGITVILEPVFSAKTFTENIVKYKPNMTFGTTSLWVYAIRSKKLAKMNLSFLHYPVTGGEALSGETEDEINDFLKEHGCLSKIIKGYGMCELGSSVTSSSPVYSKKSSAGYPISRVVVAAFDLETGLELPYGMRGEIRACTPARMKEYYKNPEQTSEYFKEDEEGRIWGCTGDIGYVDEDGDVFVLGRKNDGCLLDNGKYVYMFDIENVITEHQNIKACKVVEIEEDSHIRLAAHVSLKEDDKEKNSEVIKELAMLCQKALPDYAVPHYYKIRDSFPIHASGKRNIEALKADREELLSW